VHFTLAHGPAKRSLAFRRGVAPRRRGQACHSREGGNPDYSLIPSEQIRPPQAHRHSRAAGKCGTSGVNACSGTMGTYKKVMGLPHKAVVYHWIPAFAGMTQRDIIQPQSKYLPKFS